MKIQAFIPEWNSPRCNADYVLRQLERYCATATILDSYDVPFSIQWEEAVRRFDGDVFLWAMGDVKLPFDVSEMFWQMRKMYQRGDVGMYAPNLDYTDMTYNRSKLPELYPGAGIFEVAGTDLVFVSLNRRLLESLPLLLNNTHGWAYDYLAAGIAYKMGYKVLRDYNFLVDHPRGKAYSEIEADEQTTKWIENLPRQTVSAFGKCKLGRWKPVLKIYTVLSTRVDLLELQVQSFRKNLKEPFEFIVINNGLLWGIDYHRKVGNVCRQLGVPRIDVQFDEKIAGSIIFGNKYVSMSAACEYGVRWTWEHVIRAQQGKVVLMHHDMFLLQPAVLTDYVKDVPMAFVPQSRPGVPVHLWEGFGIYDLDKMPDLMIDWSDGEIGGTLVDVGGMSHYWFQAHPDVKWFTINPVHTEDTPEVDFHPALFEYLHFDGEPLVLHYRAASDWMKMGTEYHTKKTEWIKRQL